MICGSIGGFRVYYYKCPSILVTDSLAIFGGVNAPSYSEKVKEYQGKCIDNAVKVGDTKLTMKCSWNGTIEGTIGRCVCLEGFENVQNKCEKCGIGYFKSKQGNVKCTKCGENSHSSIDRTVCNCLHKYKREVDHLFSDKCYKIPDAPTSITFSNVTDDSTSVKWSHPSIINKTNIYIVDCNDCPSGVFPQTTNNKFIVIDGLGAFAMYKIKVTFSSQISRLIGENQTSGYKKVRTLPGVPGKVQNLQHKILNNGNSSYIELSWDEPFAKGDDVIMYLLTYGGSTKTTTFNSNVIDEILGIDKLEVAAQVSVDGKTLVGESTILLTKTQTDKDFSDSKGLSLSVFLVTIVVITLVVVFIFVGLVVYCYRKRNSSEKADIAKGSDVIQNNHAKQSTMSKEGWF